MANAGATNSTSGTQSIIERYCLQSAEASDGSPKGPQKLSAFIIRLTDASLQSLNQTIAEWKRDKSKSKPGFVEIQANGTEGVLSFGGTKLVQHRFSMMDAQRDLGPTGQLEAIAEVKPATKAPAVDGRGRMRSVGSITKRLHISATTEDTFEKTKQKAKQADEEMRKNAAKVLKGPTGGSGRGRKKLLEKISKVNAPTLQRPLTPLHRSSSPANAKKTHTPPVGRKSATSISKTGESEISKRGLRERILHRLIISPSTPQDLLAKLSGEGLSEKDREEFDAVFNQVAQPKIGADGHPVRTGQFEVKRSVYNEIKVDEWPFFSTWEQQICRRVLNTPASKPHATPPNHAHATASSESTEDTDDGTQRVKAKLVPRAPAPKRPGTTTEGAKSQDLPPTRSAAISPSTAAAIDGVSAVTLSETEPPPRKRIAIERRVDENTTSAQALASALKKFESDYPPIRSVEERRRYKQEFDKDYPIYMAAYERLRTLAVEFEKLGERLKAAPKSSTERRAVEKDILDKYKEFEGDSEIQKMRRNHEELKLKLHVLKTRVKEFDDNLGVVA